MVYKLYLNKKRKNIYNFNIKSICLLFLENLLDIAFGIFSFYLSWLKHKFRTFLFIEKQMDTFSTASIKVFFT